VHGVRSRVVGDKRVRVFSAPVVFGALTYTVGSDGRYDASVDPHNTAILVDPDGNFVERFDKNYLVLFSERIPFVDTFPFLKKILPRAAGNFTAGTEVVNLPLKTKDGRTIPLGPMICFEDILPSFGRRVGALHPQLFVNLTNDTWFGNTSEPWEHLALSVYRSVEQRTALVRAVNSGVSAYVDPAGRVAKRTYAIDPALDPRPADKLLVEVPLMEAGHTVYQKVGDLFGYTAAALTLFLWLVLPRIRRLRRGVTRSDPPAGG
jgi:apolipoprotein N-acyltransferase